MLRKEVCKGCKTKAAGTNNWSPHAEMCWTELSIVLCPSPAILSFAKRMRKKIRKGVSFSAAEKKLLVRIFSDGQTFSWLETPTPVKGKPPIFCPNKEKHKNVKERGL